MRTLQKKAVLNTIFYSKGSDENKGSILLCEWGAAHCCIAWFNQQTKTLSHLQYSSFEVLDDRAIQTITNLLVDRSGDAEKVIICSAFPQALLTPSKIYNKESKIISALYGNTFAPELTDTINEWQIINAFALPVQIATQLTEHFSQAMLTHVYTAELKNYNGFAAESQVSVHFTPKHFRVIVKRSGQLMLAQIYFYNAPLDVVYYLLKIFQELELDKEATYLILSGLIEESSPLYKEIESYFVNVHFAKPSAIKLLDNEHPQHFFTSMYNLAACVL